eukprot:TRINITY_DN7324_c0_g1_i1.p1 TRINITY_DN7324_c0_g1~~TRINITY_DN7324_c0_g1_i1.p1  ORF type:complete len:233 (+),score=33.55 TRINITY_DN7324_c0_g1_i1:545-1243(+)
MISDVGYKNLLRLTDFAGRPLLDIAVESQKLGFVRQLLPAGAVFGNAPHRVGSKYVTSQIKKFISVANSRDLVACLTAGMPVSALGSEYLGRLLLSLAPALTVATLQVLLSAGAPCNFANLVGQTPLHMCVHDADIAQMLIANGADLNAKTTRGETPLMLAASSGYVATVRALIVSCVDVDAMEEGGNTALMLAAQGGNEAIVNLLLSAEADVSAENRKGKTALACFQETPC